MNVTDRLGRDMVADTVLRWMTLVIAAFASSFLVGLLMLSVQRATVDMSRSVTTAPSYAAPNWNAESSARGSARP